MSLSVMMLTGSVPATVFGTEINGENVEAVERTDELLDDEGTRERKDAYEEDENENLNQEQDSIGNDEDSNAEINEYTTSNNFEDNVSGQVTEMDAADSTNTNNTDDAEESEQQEETAEENNTFPEDTIESVEDVQETVSEEATRETAITETKTESDTNLSGTCGVNASWILSENGVLTISGSGDVNDFESAADIPWYDYKGSIVEVIINEGITNIGTNSFYGLFSMNKITVPVSLKKIESYIFAQCNALTEVLYEGSEEDWQLLVVEKEGNEAFLEANITFGVQSEFTQKEIVPVIELSQTAFTYNGQVQKPTVIVKDDTIEIPADNYLVSFEDESVNVGTYNVNVELKGKYKGNGSASYTISAKKITPSISLSKTSFVYNGKIQKPEVTVKDGNTTITSNDYIVTYASGLKNVGTYNVTVQMQRNYSGTNTVSYKITPMKFTPSVTLSKTSFVYNGKVQKPVVTVKNSKGKLPESYYSVSFSKGLTNVGTYSVVVRMKGNFTGSKSLTYKIIPKGSNIISATGTNKQITVKWSKQTAQITGYQIQYSKAYSFSSGTKTLTIANPGTVSKTINKPEAGKEYYLRIRTYKKVGKVTYYSSWSHQAYTCVKQSIKKKSSGTLAPGKSITFSFKTANKMMFVMPIKVTAKESVYSGGIQIVLKNSWGKTLQNDKISLKQYDPGDYFESWFYDDAGFVYPDKYTYTIKNTSDVDLAISYTVVSYLKKSTTASIKNTVSVNSGNWVKIGKLGVGCPCIQSFNSSNKVITGWDVDLDGTFWVYADKKGTSVVTIKLAGGKKYTCKVTVNAGEPDFYAYLYDYYTRDNYFEVKVKNNRASDLIIVRNGAKVENVDYKSFDRKIKSAGDIVVKSGQTKMIRFYVNGSTTWPDYKDYTLCAKIKFEGVTYDWHVWYNDSVYKKKGKWFTTYWYEEDYNEWG